MHPKLSESFRRLHSQAPFWSLRYVEETRESLAVRQDTIEPPRLSIDRGAMLTAIADGGYGYCATSDLSAAGLQAALDRATAWAEATRGDERPSLSTRPTCRRRAASAAALSRGAASRGASSTISSRDECRQARIDERIVERYAALELRRGRAALSHEHRRRRAAALPLHDAVRARQRPTRGAETQSRSFDARAAGRLRAARGKRFRRLRARGSRDEALQLLAAPNCPSGRMDLLLMPDQMMLQIHESIGHPLELDRILGDERNYAGTSFVTPRDVRLATATARSFSTSRSIRRWPEELATFAFDDDGDAARKSLAHPRRHAGAAARRSHLAAARGLPGTANSRASGWNRPPIDRMANLNVEPGASALAEMIALDRARRAHAHQRLVVDRRLAQQVPVRLRMGRADRGRRAQGRREESELPRRLGDVLAQPDAWSANRDTFEVHGTLYCGKGEPNQVDPRAAMPRRACLFSDVEVFGGA